MKKIFLLFMLSVLMVAGAPAQMKYYVDIRGSQIDSLEYRRQRNERIKNFKSISTNFIFNEFLTEIIHNSQKVVYSFRWEFKVSKDNGRENVVVNTYINGNRSSLPRQSTQRTGNAYPEKETPPFTKKLAKRIAKRKPYANKTLINNILPAFELFTDYNTKITSDRLKGKPALLFFWSTQYVDCTEQIGNMNRLKEKFADKVNFIAITPDPKAGLADFMKENKFTFIRMVDAQAYFDKLKMDASSLPVCLFIDKNNNVVEIKTVFPEPAGKNNVDNVKDFESILEKLI